MNALKKDHQDLSELRLKAEKKITLKANKSGEINNYELAHDLDVHKEELKMQNDELLSTQIKLSDSVDEYAMLFDYAPTGYFILDENGIIINVNKTGSKLLEVSKSILRGTHFSLYLSSMHHQDEFYRYRNSVIETPVNHPFETEIKRTNETTFYALIESLVVRDNHNKFKHFFLTISDISEQKEHAHKIALALLKEKELHEMKSQFITIASHEFRTPLATILTSSELIEKYHKSEDHDKRDSHLRKIRGSVHRLIEILMDFMSIDDLEDGKFVNNPETFNLVESTESIINEIKALNEIHEVNFTYSGTSELVYMDQKLLKTCISNLLINAFKYSPGGGMIEINTDITDPENFNIEVRDYGIGIPEKDQPKIFSQFFRAKNSENIQGTGLGLNITKTLITLMGGRISFTSKENIGSTFSLKFEKN